MVIHGTERRWGETSKAIKHYYWRFLRFYLVLFGLSTAVFYLFLAAGNNVGLFLTLLFFHTGPRVIGFLFGIYFQSKYGTTLLRLVFLTSILFLLGDITIAFWTNTPVAYVNPNMIRFAFWMAVCFPSGVLVAGLAQLAKYKHSTNA